MIKMVNFMCILTHFFKLGKGKKKVSQLANFHLGTSMAKWLATDTLES